MERKKNIFIGTFLYLSNHSILSCVLKTVFWNYVACTIFKLKPFLHFIYLSWISCTFSFTVENQKFIFYKVQNAGQLKYVHCNFFAYCQICSFFCGLTVYSNLFIIYLLLVNKSVLLCSFSCCHCYVVTHSKSSTCCAWMLHKRMAHACSSAGRIKWSPPPGQYHNHTRAHRLHSRTSPARTLPDRWRGQISCRSIPSTRCCWSTMRSSPGDFRHRSTVSGAHF